MAFHQPTRQALQRAIRPPSEDARVRGGRVSGSSAGRVRVVGGVLAATDDTAETTSVSYLGSAHASQQPTPGRSRAERPGQLQHAGALRRPTRSRPTRPCPTPSRTPWTPTTAGDDAELDSLDSHLPEFRAVPLHHHHQSATVLPTPRRARVLPAGRGGAGVGDAGAHVRAGALFNRAA